MKKYILNAVESFVCSGADCPRSCCFRWAVEVDADTLEKWNAVDVETGQWLRGGIKEDVEKNCHFLRFVADPDGVESCEFLRDGWCGIQQKIGHDYLPSVCRDFPRRRYEIPSISYQTASLSCPEIVRLLMEGDGIYREQSVATGPLDNGHQAVLSQLDVFVRQVMHMEKFPLGIRLYYLCAVFADMIEKNAHGAVSVADIAALGKNAKRNLYDMNLARKSGRLQPDPVTAGSYWKRIYQLCHTRAIDAGFLEPAAAPFSSLASLESDSHEHYVKVYQAVNAYRSRYDADFQRRHRRAMERFIQVYFFSQGLAIKPIYNDHAMAVTVAMGGLAMLQLLIWMAYERGGLEAGLLSELIVEVHRQYVHTTSVPEHLMENPHMLQFGNYASCFLDLF